MLETTNYKFKKPELADSPPDITIMNPNWDAIDAKLKSNEEQINDLDANKANKAKGNWMTATLQSGWTGTLQYRKNDLGQVTVKGSLNVGTAASGTQISLIPEGYRPTESLAFAGLNISDWVNTSLLTIVAGGGVFIYNPTSGLTNGKSIKFSATFETL